MSIETLNQAKKQTGRIRERIATATRRMAAQLYRVIMIRKSLLRYKAAVYWPRIFLLILIFAMLATGVIVYVLGHRLELSLSPDSLSILRTLLATVGGALVGATAIGFSIILLAVQLNFARIPHGMFHKLSLDIRLLGAFGATFSLAILISATSLIPDSSWSAGAIAVALWSSILILILFFYGYRRALHLINPLVQLRYLLGAARKDMLRWNRRAQRIAPLLDAVDRGVEDGFSRSEHDTPKLLFFRSNPQWTQVSRRSVSYAVSFARRYAEQGDYDVSRSALSAVTSINVGYVEAKGKTFFSSNPIFDIPQATDGFINESLEYLRQLGQLAITRRDEEQIRQVFGAFADLVKVYVGIDYATSRHSKEHAQLAAGYLAGAVEGAVPNNMPDVVMEGVRLMGVAAQCLLVAADANGIVATVEKISAISCSGAVKQSYRPVTLVGVEQLSRLTFDLLRTKTSDVRFALNQIRGGVELVAEMFLQIRNTGVGNVHSAYLAPYFSLTKTDTLGNWLTQIANGLLAADKDNRDAALIIHNIDQWAENEYQTAKKILLLAINNKSYFVFDITHWIAHAAKILIVVSKSPAADDTAREKLEAHAVRLISVLSWIPDNREAVSFVETFGLTELLFEFGLESLSRDTLEVACTRFG